MSHRHCERVGGFVGVERGYSLAFESVRAFVGRVLAGQLRVRLTRKRVAHGAVCMFVHDGVSGGADPLDLAVAHGVHSTRPVTTVKSQVTAEVIFDL